MRDLGSTVYLTPEIRSDKNKKCDAIVDGVKMEFKNVGGNANTLEHQLLRSREQAPNVFINLETSKLRENDIIFALYKARNSVTHTDKNGKIIRGYDDYNKYSGGTIILMIKSKNDLVYLNIDDLTDIKNQA